jgi:C_GCAxxG_C_C family probable redox protein
MLAVGGRYINDFNDDFVKMATGFSGGIGDSRMQLCGAYSAGVMVIGSLTGRNNPQEDDNVCFSGVKSFTEKFNRSIMSTNCGLLREMRYGSGNIEPCSSLVRRSVRILLEVIDPTD